VSDHDSTFDVWYESYYLALEIVDPPQAIVPQLHLAVYITVGVVSLFVVVGIIVTIVVLRKRKSKARDVDHTETNLNVNSEDTDRLLSDY